MQVRVLYMGMLREIAGCERDVIQLADGASVGELFAQLRQRTPRLEDFRGAIALAVNYEYTDGSAALRDGDEVALIPPVSGGSGVRNEVQPQALPLASGHAMLVGEPIRTEQILAEIKRPEDGAVAIFDGIVRNNSRRRRTLYLDYSGYEPMALRKMEELATGALQRFTIRDVRIVHRLGRLQIGESSVYIAVSSAHRAPAFDACRWLIDTLKTTVPIWKKEYFEDGAVWSDGEPFPPEIPRAGQSTSK
jgi:molybdopterin converting factor subunit 1